MKKIYISLVLLTVIMFNAKAQLSILVVNDNGYSTVVDSVTHSLDRLGYSYTVFDAAVQTASPTAAFMADYDLVYWHTGNDGGSIYFWNGDETENQAIKDYVDGGGMLWVEGCDFLYDKYPATPQAFFPGEFVYDYLGIANYFGQSKNDDDGNGLPQLEVVSDNGIFTLDTISWRWSGHWYADALEKTDAASSIYRMGPADYALKDYYSAIYLEKGDGKVLSCAFRFDGIKTVALADTFMNQGIQYFSSFAEEKILVSDISIEASGGTASITENGGTLQLSATVLPADADLKTVEWSLESDGVSVSISQDGLLQASGTSTGNGSVTVKARAVDGSEVEGSLAVSILNQGGEFIILLVNDNANGLDRFKVIDTTLSNLDYNYNVYNTVETGDFPDQATISGHDLVIWYTGNDGVNLKLWDVSDTTGQVNTGLKFNAPLMQYIADGGDVWIQGLDFMFDIYGSAPDMFEAGDFVFDMMGIKTYVAQSHADGDDLVQLDVVSGNPVVNFTPVMDQFGGLWYADVFEITDAAEGLYTAGPSDYIYSDYFSGFMVTHGEAEIFTLSHETARMDSRGNMEAFYDDVIDYFEDQFEVVGLKESRPDQGESSLNAYPNPASHQVTINWKLTDQSAATVRLVNITGQQVFNREVSSNVNDLTINAGEHHILPGIYILSIENNQQTLTRKILFK